MTDGESYTLQEAADALDVHYMTAYRYVRLGLLPAHREGRSWVVRGEDLEAFRAERERISGGAGDPVPRRQADWSRRLERRLLAGDRAGALGVLEGALAAGAEPVDVYVDVVGPAMSAVGEGWAEGRVDVSVEHRAAVIMSQVLAVLAARFARRGVSRGAVVIGAAPGEQHSLPVRLVAEVVRLAGFEVHDLGADVPAASFAHAVRETGRLVAVGISLTVADNLDGARAAVQAVQAVGVAPVFVGGAAVADADAARALGADHWAPDARAVVELLDELV